MPDSRFDLATTDAAAAGVGLGLAALGRPAYLNIGHGADVGDHPTPDALRAQTHLMLDVAWAAGIRYFDAARSYGMAESFLGSWLRAREIAPHEVVVGSKWGYRYTAGWERDADVHEVKEHSRAMLDSQWRETRDEVGEYLDLYQIHSATEASGVLTNPVVLDGLRRLADDGVAIGLSTSGPNQAATIERALTVGRGDGTRLFAAVQATWNLLEPSAGDALAAAADAGLVVIVKETLANGRLTSHDARLADRLRDLVPGAAPDAVAIAAAVQQPWSSIVLSGAAVPDHLRQNLGALGITESLVGAEAAFAEEPGDYWGRRGGLAWT